MSAVPPNAHPSVSDLERLTRINMSAPIPIETALGHPFDRQHTEDGDYRTSAVVDERFIKESHHKRYGRPWALGRCIFDFAVESGLRPEHRLLDFGCGGLRFGVWAIRYLDAGNYFGVEKDFGSLEAAAAYEVPLHGLAEKRPRLLWNDDFRLSHFETNFNWIVDFSSSRSIHDNEELEQVFNAFAGVLAPGGHLLTSPRPDLPLETLAERGLRLLRTEDTSCGLLEGHEERYSPHSEWCDFVRE